MRHSSPKSAGTRWGIPGAYKQVISGSQEFAEAFHPAVIRALGPDWPDLGIKGDSKTGVGAHQGALTGSIFSGIPVVTMEMVVITDPEQESFFASDEKQETMAGTIADGIDAHFRSRG